VTSLPDLKRLLAEATEARERADKADERLRDAVTAEAPRLIADSEMLAEVMGKLPKCERCLERERVATRKCWWMDERGGYHRLCCDEHTKGDRSDLPWAAAVRRYEESRR
jgi:hypothetical protein